MNAALAEVLHQLGPLHLPALFEQIPIDFLFEFHADWFAADAQVVQLVEHLEPAVQDGILGQNLLLIRPVLVLQVGTVVGHARDERLRAGLRIHHLFKVPRIDALPGTAHHPAVCRRGIQRAHVIGDPEFHDLHHLVGNRQAIRILLIQKRQIAGRAAQNLPKLHAMQLIGDYAIVRRYDSGHECILFQFLPNLPHVFVLRERLQQLSHRLCEFIVLTTLLDGHFPSVLHRHARIGTVIVRLIRIGKHLAIGFPIRIAPNDPLQPLQILAVFLIHPHLCRGQIFFSPEQIGQYRPVVHRMQLIQQCKPVAQQRLPHRRLFIKVVLGKADLLLFLSGDIHVGEHFAEFHRRAGQCLDPRLFLALFPVLRVEYPLQLLLLAPHRNGSVLQQLLRLRHVLAYKADVVFILHGLRKRAQLLSQIQNLIHALAREQKMPPILQDMVHGQIDQPNVERLIAGEQRLPQMIDGRI